MNLSTATLLYLLDYTDFGGGETSFLALLKALRREAPSIRPLVVMPGPGAVYEALLASGIDARIVNFPRRLRQGLFPVYSFPAARKIDALIAQTRPLVIHANNFFGMLYAGRSAARHRVPLAWTCHGVFDIDTPTKRFVAGHYAAHVFCVSRAIRDEAARHLPSTRLSVDYLGIESFGGLYPEEDESTLRSRLRAAMNVPDQTPLIGVVGRFQAIKGHALFLDALPALRQKNPAVQVWFIGDALFGSQEEADHKALIMRRIEAEGHAGCVRLLGSRPDARRLMRALDLLVIPSFSESFSMVAVEGLEAGVPVVGPDDGGPKEIIEAPSTGLRFVPGDASSLARSIIKLLARKDEAAEFDPDAGRRRAQDQFSVDAHLRRVLAQYQILAGGDWFSDRYRTQ